MLLELKRPCDTPRSPGLRQGSVLLDLQVKLVRLKLPGTPWYTGTCHLLLELVDRQEEVKSL